MSEAKLSPNLAISESGFLFLPTTGETFTTNETGREVLALLQAGTAEPEIVQRLVEQYDVDAATATRDVHEFVMRLAEYHLLTHDA